MIISTFERGALVAVFLSLAHALTVRRTLSRPAPAAKQHSFVASSNEAYSGDAGVTTTDANADGDAELSIANNFVKVALTAGFAAEKIDAGESVLVSYERAVGDAYACGGGYMKVYDETVAPASVAPDSPYLIMFGASERGGGGHVAAWRTRDTGISASHCCRGSHPHPPDLARTRPTSCAPPSRPQAPTSAA